ncbi:hypothetical protein NQ318_015854 [Aromia moschata]|uniref:Glucose-6-phosphate 1-dehydrogenase n=1 Tax=Aromia moschata TaxID=1265417 RepID=A0AAV8YR37_9CUCU|nr:hypothetical protein NQ318_015854 [Aromia moschata]
MNSSTKPINNYTFIDNSTDTKNSELCLALYRKSLKSKDMDHDGTHFDGQYPHVFVTLGASGDLARKKIYPTLWWLFRDSLLPSNTVFYGYARSKTSIDQIKEKCKPYMHLKPGEEKLHDQFWSLNHYFTIPELISKEVKSGIRHVRKGPIANRVFYLALPSVYEEVTVHIRNACMAQKGWTRIIIEKPFGRDLATSQILSDHLASLFTEQQIYRIDHYLGKEMVQNLMTLDLAIAFSAPLGTGTT